jgi:hypothetical protein
LRTFLTKSLLSPVLQRPKKDSEKDNHESPQMKSSTTRPDHGGLEVNFPPLAILPASRLDEISKKSPTTDHPKDLSSLLESSQTTVSQESFINWSSAAALSEALALLGSMTNGSF